MLQKLIDDLQAISDPAEQGRMVTEALEHVKRFNENASELRQTAAKKLKDQGLTYKQIGELFGPEGRPLHYSRIQQILKGGPTGRWARVVREENAAKGEDATPLVNDEQPE